MTDPEAITRLIRAKTRRVNRVGLESGQLSVWLCHELRRLGVFFRHGIKNILHHFRNIAMCEPYGGRARARATY